MTDQSESSATVNFARFIFDGLNDQNKNRLYQKTQQTKLLGFSIFLVFLNSLKFLSALPRKFPIKKHL